jgi:uncharacterized protein (TIGR03435 family)
MRIMVFVTCSFWFLSGIGFGQAGGGKPAFEAASVKRSTVANVAQGMMRGGPESEDPGRLTYVNVPLRMALVRAYGLALNDQLEAPDWMATERFDIAAVIPPGTTKEQFNGMLQDLLVERFRIRVHHETRKSEGYRLMLGKNGPKLKEYKPGSPPTPVPEGYPPLAPGQTSGLQVAGGNGTFLLTARRQSLSYLDQMLGVQLHGTIDDQTGLTGTYDFNLGFVPERFRETNKDGRYPDLITAVEEQLGLKLVEGTVALDVVVVDDASKEPLEN